VVLLEDVAEDGGEVSQQAFLEKKMDGRREEGREGGGVSVREQLRLINTSTPSLSPSLPPPLLTCIFSRPINMGICSFR